MHITCSYLRTNSSCTLGPSMAQMERRWMDVYISAATHIYIQILIS